MDASSVERRDLLRTAGAASLAATAGVVGLRAADAGATARPDAGVSAYPFGLDQVRLTASRWLDNQNRTLAYLRFVDADRMLHTFRLNAGLSSPAQPCGGWEAPGIELRGHSTGHLLSALAQAYLVTGDTAYRAKADTMVDALASCQAASPGRGYHTGYLSNVSAVTYGPVVLAGSYDATTLTAPPTLTTASITRTSGTALTFTATANGSTVALVPFYDAHATNYTVYWNSGVTSP